MNKLQQRIMTFCGVFIATALSPVVAQAHTGHGSTAGFVNGFTHPIGGLDHILAMVAVGIWAAQMGSAALWIVPLSFVGVMALGGIAGVVALPVPFVEPGIVLSVLVLGVLIAAAVQLPVMASALLVGFLAVFHGYAHGAEMPDTGSGLLYGVGFILATILLHLAGLGLGILAQRFTRSQLIRFAGVAIALSSIYLWVA